MKNFAAYYAGAYAYNDTSNWFHPWFPSFNPEFVKLFDSVTNLGEWEVCLVSRRRWSARSHMTPWQRSMNGRPI